jgi:hypothetical protein
LEVNVILDLKTGGYFVEYVNGKPLPPIKNTVLKNGAQSFLQDMFQAAASLPTNFYIGLTNVSYDWTSALSDIAAGEPVGNGYARQQLTRNGTDWTVDEVNGFMRAISKQVTFTASADWDKAWNRMFICDVGSGTSGLAYAVSGPAPSDRTVLSGAGPTIQYQYYLRA